MAIFNQPATPKKDPAPMPPSPAQPESALKREPDPANEFSFAQSAAPAPVTAARTAPSAEPMAKESLIASDLTIEGKIQGAGHIRIICQAERLAARLRRLKAQAQAARLAHEGPT